MTVEELTKRLLTTFKIESDESSADYLAYMVDQAKMTAGSDADVSRVESIGAMIYDKYNMAYAQYGVTEVIAKTLLQNMTAEQIDYVLNAYTSEVYNKFFSVIGSVLDDYAADMTTLIDAGLGIQPDKQLLM